MVEFFDFAIVFVLSIRFLFDLVLRLLRGSLVEDDHGPFSQPSTLFLNLSLIIFLNIARILLIFPQIFVLAAGWALGCIGGSFVGGGLVVGVAGL